MARNIGTSVGVAIFGAVFLQSIDSTLPDRLAASGVSAEQAARYESAAHHFVPTGEGDVREATRESIVDGFLWVSGAGLGICVLAAGAAVAIRYRSREASQPVVQSPVVLVEGS